MYFTPTFTELDCMHLLSAINIDTCTNVEAGINSVFSLSAALLIGPPPLNAAANNPAPSTPAVPGGTSCGPSDPCELTPATLLLLLLLRDRIWKLLQLLGRVMLSVESFATRRSVGWDWLVGCFPVAHNIISA